MMLQKRHSASVLVTCVVIRRAADLPTGIDLSGRGPNAMRFATASIGNNKFQCRNSSVPVFSASRLRPIYRLEIKRGLVPFLLRTLRTITALRFVRPSASVRPWHFCLGGRTREEGHSLESKIPQGRKETVCPAESLRSMGRSGRETLGRNVQGFLTTHSTKCQAQFCTFFARPADKLWH